MTKSVKRGSLSWIVFFYNIMIIIIIMMITIMTMVMILTKSHRLFQTIGVRHPKWTTWGRSAAASSSRSTPSTQSSWSHICHGHIFVMASTAIMVKILIFVMIIFILVIVIEMMFFNATLILALNSSRRMNKRPEGKYLEKFSQYTKWNDAQRI